jgi:hypothetical protein
MNWLLTDWLIAVSLPHDIAITVITHSFPIANHFPESPAIEMIFIGGRISATSKITKPAAEKMNAISTCKVCDTGTVDVLGSDPDPGDTILHAYVNTGVTIL